MDTEIFVCVENATRKLIAIEMEPVNYERKDDPYLRRNIQVYLNENFPSVGTILSEIQITQWQKFQVNANERDTLYKLSGPKVSTSHDIYGFTD
ncbi:MAG: hypothetical protein AAF704_03495 [Cyanobacteria bacterium P01_D01_bin.123]